MPDAQTLSGLIANLQNPKEARDAADQLAKMRPDPNRRKQVAKLLEAVVTHGRHFDKQAAADALGVWGGSENVPFLVGFVQNSTQRDAFLNRHILAALGKLRDPRALPVMADSLNNLVLQREVAQSLIHFGSAAEPELLRVLPTGDWMMQRTVCDLLKEIGTSRSLPALDSLAATGHELVKSDAREAATAIRAAGR